MDTTADGTILATGVEDGSVGLFNLGKFYDARDKDGDNDAAAIIGKYPSPALSVTFSPSGKTLATADSNGTVDLWDVQSGTKMLTFRLTEIAKLADFHSFSQLSLTFAPDGSALIAGGTFSNRENPEDKQGLIAAWYAPRQE